MVRARTLAVARRGLQERHDAGVADAVASVVVTDRDAGRVRGLDELLRAAQDRTAYRHTEWTRCVVRVGVDHDVAARREPLALLEVRQHRVVAPTRRAIGFPCIEVAGMPTDVRHVVDPGATAEHLPARHHHPAVAQAPARAARVGCVHPIRLRIELQWRTRDRHRRRGRWWPTRFDERNRAIRILGEPRRDRRPPQIPHPRQRNQTDRAMHRNVLVVARDNQWPIQPVRTTRFATTQDLPRLSYVCRRGVPHGVGDDA